MSKGRKKTSDASKRLRGTDQPCRMDGADVPAVIAPASELPKVKLKGKAKKVYAVVGTELLKCGCQPLKGCCEYWIKQDEKSLRDFNETDAEYLAKVGLTIDDIVRIYGI